jgi:hypothetical protein
MKIFLCGFGLRVFVGSFDEFAGLFAGLEDGAGADEGEQVRGVDCAQAVLGGLRPPAQRRGASSAARTPHRVERRSSS